MLHIIITKMKCSNVHYRQESKKSKDQCAWDLVFIKGILGGERQKILRLDQMMEIFNHNLLPVRTLHRASELCYSLCRTVIVESECIDSMC